MDLDRALAATGADPTAGGGGRHSQPFSTKRNRGENLLTEFIAPAPLEDRRGGSASCFLLFQLHLRLKTEERYKYGDRRHH